MRRAIANCPEGAWGPASNPGGDIRDGAEVAELTGFLTPGMLKKWPDGMRVIVRRERPHPGAQLSMFEELDGSQSAKTPAPLANTPSISTGRSGKPDLTPVRDDCTPKPSSAVRELIYPRVDIDGVPIGSRAGCPREGLELHCHPLESGSWPASRVTPRADQLRTSHCGRCPHRSNQCSVASGNARAARCARAGSVTRSRRPQPTVTLPGTVPSGAPCCLGPFVSASIAGPVAGASASLVPDPSGEGSHRDRGGRPSSAGG